MKTPALIKKAKELFGDEGKKRRASVASLKVVLNKLRKKELALRKKLREEKEDGARKALRKEVKIVVAQRKKGQGTLKKAAKKTGG